MTLKPRVLLLALLAAATAATAQEAPDARQLLGAWRVDLRPEPDAEPYFQSFVVDSVADGTFSGTFYGSEIRDARLDTAWSAVRFGFITDDSSVSYHHSGVLRGDRLEGLTHSPGRRLLAYWTAARPAAARSPYADWKKRSIQALSDEEVSDLLAGRGMGFALAAELNHYPGPRHVLELADELALSPEQLAATREAFAAMQDEARRLGEELVSVERELDRLFAAGEIGVEELETRALQSAELRGRVRLAHLRAHLRMAELLSDEQIARYDELRGYGEAGSAPHPHDPAKHHGG